jgi:hypothetical protein
VRDIAPGRAPRELDDLLPEKADTARTAQPEARIVALVLFALLAGGAEDRGERADGPATGDLQPFRLALRGGHDRQEPDLRPAEDARGERLAEVRQALEPRTDRRQALDLARRQAEPLAGVVTEAGEAELVVSAAGEEASRQTAENRTALGFMGGEPPQRAVEYERRVGRGKRTAVRLGRYEEVGGCIHGRRANNRRRRDRCQAGFLACALIDDEEQLRAFRAELEEPSRPTRVSPRSPRPRLIAARLRRPSFIRGWTDATQLVLGTRPMASDRACRRPDGRLGASGLKLPAAP